MDIDENEKFLDVLVNKKIDSTVSHQMLQKTDTYE